MQIDHDGFRTRRLPCRSIDIDEQTVLGPDHQPTTPAQDRLAAQRLGTIRADARRVAHAAPGLDRPRASPAQVACRRRGIGYAQKGAHARPLQAPQDTRVGRRRHEGPVPRKPHLIHPAGMGRTGGQGQDHQDAETGQHPAFYPEPGPACHRTARGVLHYKEKGPRRSPEASSNSIRAQAANDRVGRVSATNRIRR